MNDVIRNTVVLSRPVLCFVTCGSLTLWPAVVVDNCRHVANANSVLGVVADIHLPKNSVCICHVTFMITASGIVYNSESELVTYLLQGNPRRYVQWQNNVSRCRSSSHLC